MSDSKNSDDMKGEVEKSIENSDSSDDRLFTQSSNTELGQTSVSNIGTFFTRPGVTHRITYPLQLNPILVSV